MIYINVAEKSMGAKLLMKGFELRLNTGEKLGFIGRNGLGKTTLINMMTGKDQEYDGALDRPKHVVMMATSQEHHGYKGTTIDYICGKLPHFSELHSIITHYPEHMGSDVGKITKFSEALEKFSELGYYDVENSLQGLFDAYQLPRELLEHPFSSLSGGQKRLVEVVAIQLAEPQVALLDEPTNHMDYVAKAAFIEWLRSTKSSCLVISHDRDVLKVVDRMIELKDLKSFSYPGNYDAYLSQNAIKTTNAINAFQTSEKRINNIKEQIEYARSKAPGYKGKAGKNPWIVMGDRLKRELDGIMDDHSKPSFWIDRDSVDNMSAKVADNYDKFKAKNIRLHKVDWVMTTRRYLQESTSR
jgi:ATP-binding cassette, subfamily F, member 3